MCATVSRGGQEGIMFATVSSEQKEAAHKLEIPQLRYEHGIKIKLIYELYIILVILCIFP